MDKILYICTADYIYYDFPKRKWWLFTKKSRVAYAVFSDVFSDKDLDIRLQIREQYDSDYRVFLDKNYRKEIFRSFLLEVMKEKCAKKHSFEILLVIDPIGEVLPDILPEFAEDMNDLAILTDFPERYAESLEIIEEETGLPGMVFTDYRDFSRYQRHVCGDKKVLVFIENGNDSSFYRFSKGSLLIDLSETESYRKMVLSKRMETECVSLPNFLDNIVKNRYNSLVNEGLFQIQGISYVLGEHKKRKEKREGIKKWKKRKIF